MNEEDKSKIGCYCPMCYNNITDKLHNQDKGYRVDDIEGKELCGCGKEALYKITDIYDIKIITKHCAYDKERICDDTCIAFLKDRETLYSELHFDKSNVVPQFDWKKTLVVNGNWCVRLKDHVGKFKIIKSIKDGDVIVHEEDGN